MRIVDVDAHLHEPLDWVEKTNPALAQQLGPPPRFMDVAGAVFSTPHPVFAALPERQRPSGQFDMVPPGFVRHLQITDERQPPLEGEGGEPLYSADGRLAFCDERGIAVQFLNPTFLVGPLVQAARAGRSDLFGDIRRTWNTWAAEDVAGHTDRLIPVTQIDLGDLEGSIAEMERMRNLGSRAFSIPEAPVGSGRFGFGSGSDRPSIGKSISHPDFEPLWSAAEDLGMAAFAHVGFSRERINPGWANNGADDMKTFSLLNMLVGSQLGPQLLLGAMIYDGVLERHPKLTVVVEEVGIDWLPHLVHSLEMSIGRNAPELEDGEYRPSHLVIGETYDLPLAPVEYLVRQVRVTPLPASHPIHPVIDVVPHELLCFSSDFPHVEGSSSAVDILEQQLVGASDKVRSDFFGGVGELIGV